MLKDLKIAVVGLGYVGLPVAVAFSNKFKVIGFDINKSRIETLLEGNDYTNEVSYEELSRTQIDFTDDPEKLSEAGFIIVTVPTSIDSSNQPDLTSLLAVCKTVGKNMKKGAVVVFESTVYPGTTEEKCIPLLEKYSGLEAGKEFFVGYSPERINPGDKKHTFTKIKKVVSGQNEAVLDFIASIYSSVVEAGIFKAKSIRVAEAAKVIENTQRDVNIALMNELALICNRLEIDTNDVLETAGTKWNFLKFYPGLVGGHCIGVDPYYLTHKAQAIGHHPEVILAGRRINDGIGPYIARTLVKKLIQNNLPVQGTRVTILGLTFKENVPDLRNSKVVDVIRELQEYGVDVQIADACSDTAEAERQYGLTITPEEELLSAPAVILAVPHEKYKKAGWKQFDRLLTNKEGIVFDIKSVLDPKDKPNKIQLWRL
ncbi:nucleotide sugar dehydrogenase [Planococcus sp. N028]|uniref:Nucleotide sugar dehydrogenase n=1 Tax=Planococcus shixiaomingii TaxID=3058393 RepID=A0ABT8N147_9BACL|nr:nucleotide sugar dehydrogenase [Planococcus sp. N028]MDN7241618.1 nucleotide sugar dehydrogenase [Planococcus sp. N028]